MKLDTQKEKHLQRTISTGIKTPRVLHKHCEHHLHGSCHVQIYKLLFYVKITVQYSSAKTGALQKPITVSVAGYAEWYLENKAGFVVLLILKTKSYNLASQF